MDEFTLGSSDGVDVFCRRWLPSGQPLAVTVMVMAVDVVLLVATSAATALSVWEPIATLLLTFQETEYGDDVSVPSCLVPSR